MNPYFILILTFLVATFALDTLIDGLNLTRLKGPLPAEFKDIYDSKKYEDSLRYQRETHLFQAVQRTFSFLATLLFILLGGFNTVDLFARSFGWDSIPTGLVFVGTLALLSGVLHLPFSLYETFVLEEKYGFNQTTLKTFLGDLLKGVLLGSLLGGLVFSGILFFFDRMGPEGWLYAWIGITVFQLLLSYLAPAVIMPLFNRFSPLVEGPLKDAIEAFSDKLNFKLSGIYTMDSSKRSTKGNAFFTGFGRFRRLVLFDTLVSKQSVEELVAILAHEIGHFKRKHILKSMLLSMSISGLMFFTFSLFLNNPRLFEAFQMRYVSIYGSLVFIGFFYSPLFRLFALFTQRLSRKYEFEADTFAVETYGHPSHLISALKKLSMDNLSHLTPHPLKVFFDYSHPPILKRIEALREQERNFKQMTSP